jgi:hypothetical protein
LLSIAFGDSEGALSLLSSALENKEAELPWLAVDPRFDVIRHDGTFAEIVSKVKS